MLNRSEKLEAWRRKSAMVLFQIEKSLGNLIDFTADSISDLPRGLIKQIQLREESAGRIIDESRVNSIISATHLQEIVNLAQSIFKGRPEEEHVKKLRNLFDLLEIIDIRNAVSHPNKDFHPSYWYRVATIATDPVIDILNLTAITQAFLDAEANRICSPPDEWLREPIWSIKNNLPKQFQHDITGLKGRKNQLSQLKKEIANERNLLIAIVAPGGVGKTAIILQALKEIVSLPESALWVDQILYFSSKIEYLTASGIEQKKTSVSTIEGIQSSISRALSEDSEKDLSFEEACSIFKSRRIVICLDNLETILKDDRDSFKEFYENLPREWRIIVTSRINVDSAKRIDLYPLTKEDGIALARNYLSKTTNSILSATEIEELVDASKALPITIILSIDILNKGTDLKTAQLKASEGVLDFSYQNLIEALSRVSHEVIECLYEIPVLSRLKACDILNRNDDEIAEAFRQLGDTSLVLRVPDQTEESIELSASLREYLQTRYVNEDIRKLIQTRNTEIKNIYFEHISQSNSHRHELHKYYIPDNIDESIIVPALESINEIQNKALNKKKLYECLNRINRMIEVHRSHAFLYRFGGLILSRLQDYGGAKRQFELAWENHQRDYASGIILSNELRMNRESVNARNVAEELIKNGWDKPEKSDIYHASLVIKNYYLALISCYEPEQVIAATENWQDDSKMRATLGLLRARALRGYADLYGITKSYKKLIDAIDVFNILFSTEGYSGAFVDEAIKLLFQLSQLAVKYSRLPEDSKFKMTHFVDNHLVKICLHHNTYKLDHLDICQCVQDLSFLSLKDDSNPLQSERWKNLIDIEYSTTNIDSEYNLWIDVKVYSRPKPKTGNECREFLFAEDSNRQQYMIHIKNFSNRLDKEYWPNIAINEPLQVIPLQGEEGQAIKVDKARFPKN